MYDSNLQESERQSNEFEHSNLGNDFNGERMRPYTSGIEESVTTKYNILKAEHQTGEARKQNYKSGNQGFRSQDKFPALGEVDRAVSAKPYKTSERGLKDSRKLAPGTKSQNFVLQSNKIVQSPFNDFARMKPKNIMQDKERLYEETLQLKQLVNGLREENLKLKTKVNNLEREATKFEKMIQEANAVQQKENVPAAKSTENHLTLTLKQNVKELKTVLKKKEDELTEVKKSMKYTKIQELETEMKAFQDEAARLKTMMDHVMQTKGNVVLNDTDKAKVQEDYFAQATQLKVLRKDNEEMATAIKILEEQNFEYDKKITELEKKLKREQNLHKKALQEKDQEIQKLRNEVNAGGLPGVLSPIGKRPMTSVNRDDALRQELEKKTLENNNLLNQLAEKRNQVLNLERQLRDLKADCTEKITSAQNEKQALLRELEKLRNAKAVNPNESGKGQGANELKVQDLKPDDYARRASLQRAFSQEEKDAILMYGQGLNSKKAGSPTEKKQQAKSSPRKRVQKVRPEDVKDIGQELNLRLRIKKLTFDEINKAIWPDKVRKTGTVTVKDMIEILKNEPFNMTNEEDTITTARFLIEENEHEYLYYDENAKNDLQIVKSILKKVVGHLPLFDEDRNKRMHEEISEICITNKGGLRENLKALCKSGFLTAKDLKEACNLIEVTITDEQIDYVVQKLFEHSDNIHKLSIDRLFEVFTLKPKDLTPGDSLGTLTDSSPVMRNRDMNEDHDAEEGKINPIKSPKSPSKHPNLDVQKVEDHENQEVGHRISEKPEEEDDEEYSQDHNEEDNK